MKKEKNSGNVKISKEVIIVCSLILFFIILVIVGRFIRGKFNNKQDVENQQSNNMELNTNTLIFSQDTDESSGEEIEGVDTIDNYELVTETLKISDFDVSKNDDRISITGSVENLTNEKIENLNLITSIYDARNNVIQQISTAIPAIQPKSKSQYSFSRLDNNGEAKKIKVEVLKDGIIKDKGTANVYKENND